MSLLQVHPSERVIKTWYIRALGDRHRGELECLVEVSLAADDQACQVVRRDRRFRSDLKRRAVSLFRISSVTARLLNDPDHRPGLRRRSFFNDDFVLCD